MCGLYRRHTARDGDDSGTRWWMWMRCLRRQQANISMRAFLLGRIPDAYAERPCHMPTVPDSWNDLKCLPRATWRVPTSMARRLRRSCDHTQKHLLSRVAML